MFKGRLRCHYPTSVWDDEVASAGDAYYFRAGHVLIYEEPSEILELNPASPLNDLMDFLEAKAAEYASRDDRPGR